MVSSLHCCGPVLNLDESPFDPMATFLMSFNTDVQASIVTLPI